MSGDGTIVAASLVERRTENRAETVKSRIRSGVSALALGMVAGFFPMNAAAQAVLNPLPQTQETRISAADADDLAAVVIRFETAWDDNLLRLDENEPIPEGRSQEDIRYEAVAQLDLQKDVSLQQFFLRGSVGYIFHQDNDFLDRERINLNGGVNWKFTPRCGGVAVAGLFRGQSELNDLDEVIENRRETVSGNVTAGCTLGLGLRPEVGVRRRVSENSAERRQANDLDATTYTAGVRYSRSPRSGVGLRYTNESIDYPNRLTESGAEPNVEVERFEMLANRQLGDDINISASLGLSSTESNDAAAEDFDGTIGGIEVRYRPSRRFAVGSSFDRNIDAQSDIGSNFFVRDRVAVEASYQLTDKTQIRAAYAQEDRDLRGQFTVGGRRNDEVSLLEAAVTYDPIDLVRITAGVRDTSRDADAEFADFDATRVFISLGVVR